jgi:N-acetylglucosaminyl-diphospho-decaprenol L-rhamnosyltransferase
VSGPHSPPLPRPSPSPPSDVEPTGRSVSVCIVNWNTREHLERCLRSLPEACEGLDAEIIVVDNASADGSAAMVAGGFPGVRLFALSENLGFAAANNLAMEHAHGDYLLILNPDIYAPAGSVTELVDFLAAQPGPAGAGAALVGHDGKVQTPFYRRFPSRAQVLLFYTALRYVTRGMTGLAHRYFDRDVAGSEPVAVDQLPGACCLLPREIVRRVGPMDPDYFIWYEDVDWCFRIRGAGYPLWALPGVRMLHAGGASFGSWSKGKQLRQFFLALFRFLIKFRLEGLTRFSLAVLAGDLWVEEMGVRLVQAFPAGARLDIPRWELLRDLRREMKELVAAHRRGLAVRLTSQGPVYEPASAVPAETGRPA